MTKLWRLRNGDRNVSTTKIMPHDEFLKRIQKTLYSSSIAKCQTTISRPLSMYASDIFNEPHRHGYSLNRLSYVTIGNLQYATPCSLILSMIYLDRLRDVDPMYSRRITPTELFLVSMMVSTKFYCGYDEDVYLSDWAEQGNISQDHLKQLELEFLSAINWNLFVSNKDFFEKLKLVEIEIAKRQGLERGWLTYTEISNLLPSLAIAKAFLQHTTIFAVSYAAGAITIAGAFFLASKVPGTALYSPSKSEPMKLNATTSDHIVSGSNHSSPFIDRDSDNSACCNIDEVSFDRLSNDLLENGTASQQQITNNEKVSSGVVYISNINFASSAHTESDENLRNFLQKHGSKWNETDYLNSLNHVTDESLCRNFGNLVTWMKLI